MGEWREKAILRYRVPASRETMEHIREKVFSYSSRMHYGNEYVSVCARVLELDTAVVFLQRVKRRSIDLEHARSLWTSNPFLNIQGDQPTDQLGTVETR